MRLRIGTWSAIAIVLLTASASPTPAETPPGTATPEDIPLETFFKNPAISDPKLSPNGHHIAFVYSESAIQRVFVRGVVASNTRGLVEFPMREVRLTSLAWANSNRLLLSGIQSNPKAAGTEPSTTRLYSIGRERPRLKDLSEKMPNRGPAWPALQVRFEDKVIGALPKDRDNVLVSHLEFGQRTPSVSRLNIASGRLRLQEAATDGIDRWHADRDGNIRAAEASGQLAGGKSFTLFARSHVDQNLLPVFESADARKANYRFAGFHEAPYLIYVLADHEGRDALFEFDIGTKTLGELVFAHPDVDVAAAHFSEARRTVVGARFTTDEPQIAFFDLDAKKEQLSIDHSFSSVHKSKTINRIVSSTSDGNLAIIEVGSQLQPPVFYAYDRAKKEINFIFEQRPEVPVDRLAEVKRIDFAARDAAMIPGYLTLPRDGGPAGLPMIVLPHDGPSARDAKLYNPVVQFFASRGYAVLQVNYRGSRGFGREFRLAGMRDGGRMAREDVVDGVKWAIKEGVADPNRIGIYGIGFGGYSALMALVTEPSLFRAGASFAGITDLASFSQEGGNFSWQMEMAEMLQASTQREREKLRLNSPVGRVEEFRVPVLLGHGVRDSRVGVDHARNFSRALKAAGKDVKYLEYPEEFEKFVLESSRVDFYTQLLSFFEKNLAPGATPPKASDGAAAAASMGE